MIEDVLILRRRRNATCIASLIAYDSYEYIKRIYQRYFHDLLLVLLIWCVYKFIMQNLYLICLMEFI